MANIWFSNMDRTEVYELPLLPQDMPELNEPSKNEEFEGMNGTYNFIGNVGLVTFSIEAALPAYANKYRFAKSQINPYSLINLWRRAKREKQPVRIVINRNKRQDSTEELLNWIVSIENLSWHELRNGDIAYKIDLKEYKEVTL